MGSTRTLPLILLLTCAAALAGSAVPRGQADAKSVAPVPEYQYAEMLQAANSFLASLSAAQRSKALFAFEDAERLNWHFVPRPRRGLALKEMSAAVFLQHLRHTVPHGAVGIQGGRTPSLAQLHTRPGHSYRHRTAFFGANPAEVRGGQRRGLRALADEEDIGRERVVSLDERQRARTLISAAAPSDIVTGNAARVEPLSPIGIRVSELRPEQAAILVRLLEVYLGRMPEPLATQRRAALERANFAEVAFAWAGSLRRGEAHYYRIQGPSFLVEYDNTQNDANHIHTVWRDFEGAFGRDLLREHYRTAIHRH